MKEGPQTFLNQRRNVLSWGMLMLRDPTQPGQHFHTIICLMVPWSLVTWLMSTVQYHDQRPENVFISHLVTVLLESQCNQWLLIIKLQLIILIVKAWEPMTVVHPCHVSKNLKFSTQRLKTKSKIHIIWDKYGSGKIATTHGAVNNILMSWQWHNVATRRWWAETILSIMC